MESEDTQHYRQYAIRNFEQFVSITYDKMTIDDVCFLRNNESVYFENVYDYMYHFFNSREISFR